MLGACHPVGNDRADKEGDKAAACANCAAGSIPPLHPQAVPPLKLMLQATLRAERTDRIPADGALAGETMASLRHDSSAALQGAATTAGPPLACCDEVMTAAAQPLSIRRCWRVSSVILSPALRADACVGANILPHDAKLTAVIPL